MRGKGEEILFSHSLSPERLTHSGCLVNLGWAEFHPNTLLPLFYRKCNPSSGLEEQTPVEQPEWSHSRSWARAQPQVHAGARDLRAPDCSEAHNHGTSEWQSHWACLHPTSGGVSLVTQARLRNNVAPTCHSNTAGSRQALH